MALLTTRQLQAELQVCPATLWSYRKQGMPYFVLRGRTVRYRLPDVIQWLEEQSAPMGVSAANGSPGAAPARDSVAAIHPGGVSGDSCGEEMRLCEG
jgi:hypothetical protein